MRTISTILTSEYDVNKGFISVERKTEIIPTYFIPFIGERVFSLFLDGLLAHLRRFYETGLTH